MANVKGPIWRDVIARGRKVVRQFVVDADGDDGLYAIRAAVDAAAHGDLSSIQDAARALDKMVATSAKIVGWE